VGGNFDKLLPAEKYLLAPTTNPEEGTTVHTQTIATTVTTTPPATAPLTDRVIPAVRGEFYSYSTQFTLERPLYAMMKCRANKDRAVTFAEEHADEVNLVFVFKNGLVRIGSPLAPESEQILAGICDPDELGETYFATTDMTEAEFEAMRQEENGAKLAEFCGGAIGDGQLDGVPLSLGAVIAVVTDCGKFGLLRITYLTASTVRVDACHILL